MLMENLVDICVESCSKIKEELQKEKKNGFLTVQPLFTEDGIKFDHQDEDFILMIE